jgi:alpha-L-fucosidase
MLNAFILINKDLVRVLSTEDYTRRMEWFHEARFGIFVHFGLYSVLGRGEWVQYEERIPTEEYARLQSDFRPSEDCVKRWADAIAESGARYAILTARHHDGFCLWPTETTDFHLKGRDLVAEWCAELRARGIRVGLYYSLLDWRFPGYFLGRDVDPDGFESMVDQAHRQVEELVTGYGKLDVLWYDGNWLPKISQGEITSHNRPSPEAWRAHELNLMVRRLQPDILINNRSGLDEDLDTPEQHVSASAQGRGWEACMTIGDARGWGFLRNNPTRKSAVQLIENLATAASGEGNLLLNFGPDGMGEIPEADGRILAEMGKWLEANGEAIYGCRKCPFGSGLGGPLLGPYTAKDRRANAIVVRWPGKDLTIPGVANEVVEVRMLASGEKLSFRWASNRRLVVETALDSPPSDLPTVIEITLDSEPRAAPFPIPL